MSEIQGIELPHTTHDKSIPLPPKTPSLQTLRSWLPLYFQKADHTLEQLNSILSTPSGTDTFLLTLCYTSLLSSTILSSFSLHRLHRAARQIIEKAISLPPNATIIIDTSAIPPSRLLLTAQRLKALSSLISDFRIFARLWGLIGIWKWGKGALEKPPKDVLVKRIVYAQVLVNIFYQYLENGAYLSSKGVMGWSTDRQNKAWLWSSRFWMAHVGLDFIRLYHEYVTRKNRGTEEERKAEGSKGDAEWRANWTKEMVVNLAYAPLTVHWSLENGLIGDFWVGLLGSVAGIAGFQFLWKNTSKT